MLASTAMYWNTTHHIQDILHLLPGNCASISGRVTSFRRQGGIAFGHVQDETGKIQFCFQKKMLGEALFKSFVGQIKVGVHIGINGSLWLSSTGEKTLLVGTAVNSLTGAPLAAFPDSFPDNEDHWDKVNNFRPGGEGIPFGSKGWHPRAGAKYSFRLLQNTWRGFPDKLHGISDSEAKLRLRYLDCAINLETRDLFASRFRLISEIRTFLQQEGFLEIETPILNAQASGAMAKPFTTRHDALDADLFMRIAPETYLKRATAAGLGKVFEVGKQFRNEGIDPSHLQEFTSVEWYWPNANYMDNLEMFRRFLRHFSHRCAGIPDAWKQKMREWSNSPVASYRELFTRFAGCSPDELSCQEVDERFKSLVVPMLTEPTFIVDYPAHMSPMAERVIGDDRTAQQWQFVVSGWELVKCYTELTDPEIQRNLLEKQMADKASGSNEEAMDLEEDFLECMEYGMPRMSGLGLGIDRLICLLAEKESLRDVVLFPTLLTRK